MWECKCVCVKTIARHAHGNRRCSEQLLSAVQWSVAGGWKISSAAVCGQQRSWSHEAAERKKVSHTHTRTRFVNQKIEQNLFYVRGQARGRFLCSLRWCAHPASRFVTVSSKLNISCCLMWEEIRYIALCARELLASCRPSCCFCCCRAGLHARVFNYCYYTAFYQQQLHTAIPSNHLLRNGNIITS